MIPKNLSVGYGKGDITPRETGLPIQGGGNKLSTGVASSLYAICIALTDDTGSTVLFMSVDSCYAGGYVKDMHEWIEIEYGIPASRLIISSIHQHSTPEPYVGRYPGSIRYFDLVIDAMKDAVRQAMADRAPAEMYINTVQTQAMNFVRHYFAKDAAGTVVGDNYNEAVGAQYGYKDHVTEADKVMQLVKFERGEGKAPIILVNFQCHPHMGYASTEVHADWPGVMRAEVENELGAQVMYISGAGGNLNSHSRIAGELPYAGRDWKSHGKKAAGYVIGAEGSYTQVNTGRLAVKFETKTYPIDHSMDHLADIAAEITRATDISEAEGKAVLEKYPGTFTSVHHARSAMKKSQMSETIDIPVGVIAFGDVAISCHMYEMFDTNGMELKAGTVGNANYPKEEQLVNPYAMTVISTMANGTKEYIPSKYGYAYGGYEKCITKFAAGSGEKLVTSYLEILNELHG